MEFFIADTHFNHTNIIKYCNRPFDTIKNMNETIIMNWNSKVTNNDLVYHLGDFGFGNYVSILQRLNGRKILIIGSHDKQVLEYKKYFEKLSTLLEIKIENQIIVLCHYAMRVWAKSHYNSWHLYGHSHNTLSTWGKSLDVGVESLNYFPISFKELKTRMNELPDNFNLVKKIGGLI